MLLSQTVWASRGWKGAERLISLEGDPEGLEPAGTSQRLPTVQKYWCPGQVPSTYLSITIVDERGPSLCFFTLLVASREQISQSLQHAPHSLGTLFRPHFYFLPNYEEIFAVHI